MSEQLNPTDRSMIACIATTSLENLTRKDSLILKLAARVEGLETEIAERDSRRCGDCKWYAYPIQESCPTVRNMLGRHSPDWHCADFERKDKEDGDGAE